MRELLAIARLCYILTLFILCLLSVHAKETPGSNIPVSRGLIAPPSSSPRILLVDVDNTLYNEQEAGIERQIVQSIYNFCSRLNITSEHADKLHHEYGSTIEGLRQTLSRPTDSDSDSAFPQLQHDFYQQVYEKIDVSSLLQSLRSSSSSSPTGYTHATQRDSDAASLTLKKLLTSCGRHRHRQVHLASNSPRKHVLKVVQALGLTRVPWKGLWSPDSPSRPSASFSYPIKTDPQAFFGSLLANEKSVLLLDDSPSILAATSKYFRSIQISHEMDDDSDDGDDHKKNGGVPLTKALCQAFDWLDPVYKFSEVDYLKAKNAIDLKSINRDVWKVLQRNLDETLLLQCDTGNSTSLCIVDLGAGLLSMLRLMMHGYSTQGENGGGDSDYLPSLMAMSSIRSNTSSNARNGSNSNNKNVTIRYYAYEPNRRLERECLLQLQQLGFERKKTFQRVEKTKKNSRIFEPEHVLVKQTEHDNVQWIVHLRLWDYEANDTRHQPAPHLIVGCCFADLVQNPRHLARSILRRFLTQPADFPNTLVYFPITFAGTTQFVPPAPFEVLQYDDGDDGDDAGGGERLVPSDTTAFALYSKALVETQCHNLDPRSLKDAFCDYGAVCLKQGSSDWVVDPSSSSTPPSTEAAADYLWETLLYFFGTVAGPELQYAGWDAQGWLKRARQRRPSIHVSNMDLLFRVPRLGKWELASETNTASGNKEFREIQFQAPRKVTTVSKRIHKLEEHQVRVQAVASLISSGTELKIFTGSFDDTAALDTNIKGMTDQRMTYPLAYGYSLVGRVVECGSQVCEGLMGKLVFCFSPHGTQAVVNQESLHIVPEGIDALDAIFMPSVETALSLVHDANPRFGERVAVFGQGLIGLLVTGILSLMTPRVTEASRNSAGMLTTVDTMPSRLAASAQMGSMQALTPSEIQRASPFDVAIEVSGNSVALQTAIDVTRDGGLVVVGSWYGSTGVKLNLGIDFHRSHKVIRASQVSEIPASLRATWSKQRRFQLTWDLVKTLRPSRLVTCHMSLDDAQEAYELLETGTEIAVAFEY